MRETALAAGFAPLLLAALTACGSSAATPATSPAPPAAAPAPAPAPAPVATALPAAFAPVAWLEGDWTGPGAGDSEHWIAAQGVLFGVGLHAQDFEVLIVDDAQGPGPADGVLRLTAMPRGMASVDFALEATAAGSITFGNPQHDAPKRITYARAGDQLTATLDNGAAGPASAATRIPLVRATAASAPALEQADREFAADAGARGADGWAAAFDPKGAMWGRRGRITGADIRAAMVDTFQGTIIDWEPAASRLAASGEIGFTIGNATYRERATGKVVGKGCYVTIWHRQPDGRWKVLFDTGRPVNE